MRGNSQARFLEGSAAATPHSYSTRLFGPLTLEVDGSAPVKLAPSRIGALLALLALEVGRPRTREEISDQLWPDDDAEAARHKLRQTLHDLRSRLAHLGLSADSILLPSRAALQLNSNAVSVDVVELEAALAAATKTADPAARADMLSAAVSLYKGELLPGFYLERFIAEKSRLEELYHSALKQLAYACEDSQQYEHGIETASRLVALNPLNEEAHFCLMRLYAATGQPSSVLRQYQSLERTLKEELGATPSAAARHALETLRETAQARAASRQPASLPAISQVARTELCDVGAVASGGSCPVQPPLKSRLAVKRRNVALWSASSVVVACALITGAKLARRNQPVGTPTASLKRTLKPKPVVPVVFARYVNAPDERGSEPTAMTADDLGNVYVAGFVQTMHTDADFITLKYDQNGRLLWRRRYDGTGHDVDRLRRIATDSADNVLVSGESDNGHGNGSTRLSGLDVVTIKYSPNGRELWKDRYNDIDNGDDRPVKLLVDPAGCVYVLCGCHHRWAGKDAGCDFVLIKYSPGGKRQWVRRYDGETHGDNVPTDMALLAHGVCVCGYSHALYKTGPEYDYVTMVYAADGARKWLKRYGAGNQADDFARGIRADQDGNVYVVGEGRGLPGTPDEFKTGCVMVKYSPTGETVWVRGTENEADRLQRVTAEAFWADGSAAVAGPVVSKYGKPMYRVVLREARDGKPGGVFDCYAPSHPLYNAPCSVTVWPEDIQSRDTVWVSGSESPQAGPELEFLCARASRAKLAWEWIAKSSPSNRLNAARAAVLHHHGNHSAIVVAGLCMDSSNVGGITLVEYDE